MQRYWDYAIRYDPATNKPVDGYTVAGYCFIMDRPNNPREPIRTRQWEAKKIWLRTTLVKNPAEAELVVDSLLSTDVPVSSQYPYGHNFGLITAGGMWGQYQIHDQSSHLRGEGRPLGSNAGFLDGHVDWRKFISIDEGPIWIRYGNPHFWW